MLLPLLRTYLAPYKRPIAAVLLFQLIQTLANLYLPGLNADIIDRGVVAGDTGFIVRTGLIMLAITIVQVVCTIIAVYYGARTAMALGRDLRAGVFGKVETFAAREMAQYGAPTLITRSTNDVQQVQLIVFMALTLLVTAPIMCFGGIVMALRQDVELSGLLVLVIPALVISIGLVIRQMRPLFRLMQTKIDTINGVMREQIMGIRVIRAFVKEDYEADRFGDANRESMEVAVAVGRLMSMMFPIVMLIMNVSVVLATWFGGYRISSGDLDVGTLTAFQNYLVQILMSVMMATFMLML
ncbi:MAG: multidrug transporter ATP-binding protein, partial [Aeromicrobium sp.]|nr:multidrug transporter ATP-binding protein [Aeromicrobium sp.]